MSAESWPTEALATRAVDAAARKAYDMQKVQAETEGEVRWPRFESLPAEAKLALREAVLPIVWAALSDLPDPRRVAWEEGYVAGHDDCAFEEGYNMGDAPRPTQNPYPA